MANPNSAGQETRTVAERALLGLSEIKEALVRGDRLDKKFTVRSIDLNLKPSEYDAESIRDLRETLNVSQKVFAELLCVSLDTVRAWELGRRSPSRMARRLFDEIRSDPGRWLDWIKSMVESRQIADIDQGVTC